MIDQENTQLTIPSGPAWQPSLEQCVSGWLHAKFGKSQSAETLFKYTDVLTKFREILHKAGTDLDGDPALVAMLAQGWAAQGKGVGRESVTGSTFNLKVTVLSSFFEYAMRHNALERNPMKLVDRRSMESQDYAQPLESSDVQTRLARIDRSELIGLRDYALLSLALTTGRRKAELAALQFGDFRFTGNIAIVTWRRCKGAKVMRDELTPGTTAAIVAYLQAAFGDRLGEMKDDSPIWLICAHNRAGQVMHGSALRKIWYRHLGSYKIHTTRHTFALNSEKVGAKLSDIGSRLGHNSLATTSVYMQRLHSSENPYARPLASSFGIE